MRRVKQSLNYMIDSLSWCESALKVQCKSPIETLLPSLLAHSVGG